MRKGLVVLLAAALVVAFALPAMADTSVVGFYRAKGHVGNYKTYSNSFLVGDTSPDDDPGTRSYVEQRLRAKVGFGDENVKAFYYGEFDQMWGDSSGSTSTRGSGAALSADSVNLETKNMYLWFKVPDTTFDFTVGLQNQSDSYAGIIFGVSDMAGVFTNFKVEPVNVRLGWAKWFEGDVDEADDVDLYVAEVKFAPTKDAKLGLNLYFLNGHDGTPGFASSDDGKLKLYMPGIDFSAKAGPASLTGFFLYQTGAFEFPGSPDIDIKAFALDLRADMALGPGKFFIEGLYISGGDGSDPEEFESIISAADYSSTQVFYYRTDMQILFPNGDDINTSYPLNANYNYGGRGLWHVGAGYSQKFGDKVSGKVGVGHLSIVDNDVTDPSYVGKNVATEFNFNVNYNISKGLDLGLYGAYAMLGDAFDQAPGDPSLDDVYDVYARLNFGF